MSLDTTTIILEIINFLVLVWLLQRLLYQPVLNIIERRRLAIGKELEETKQMQAETQGLKEQYENRLKDWDKTKESLNRELQDQLSKIKEEKLLEIRLATERERESKEAVENLRMQELTEKCERSGLLLGAKFASKLLSQLVGAETEAKLCDIVIAELAKADSDLAHAIKDSVRKRNGKILVESAMPLKTETATSLESVLSKLAESQISLQFKENPELLAGLSIDLGALVLQANLKNELNFFNTNGGAYANK